MPREWSSSWPRASDSLVQPLERLRECDCCFIRGSRQSTPSDRRNFPAQPLLFSENALSYVSLQRTQLDSNQTGER